MPRGRSRSSLAKSSPRLHAAAAPVAQQPPAKSGKVVQFPAPLGPTKPPTGEMGVSGTANILGNLLTETNEQLYGPSGYGLTGTRKWGEWEYIRRTDPAIAAALEMSLAPIRDASISVKTPEVDDGEKAITDDERAIADFVEENLLEWMEPSWAELTTQIVTGTLGTGFSLHEPVFDVREDARLPNGQGFYLRKMAQRLPNTLWYNPWVEKNGELDSVRQQGLKDGQWVSDLMLPANRVILCTWNREGNNYAGYSAFRPVWYICKIREQLLRILGIGHQRESCGIPIATMEKDVPLTKTQRAKLRRLLENCIYHENAAVVLPPGVKLAWWTANSSSTRGGVIDAWHRLGVAILEIVHAQQISLGTNDTGSRSVGQVHERTKGTFVEGVAALIEGTLNGIGTRPYTGLVRKIIAPNFGDLPRLPRISISLPRSELAPHDFAAAIKTALDGKAITWRFEDENKLRDRLGLDAIDEDERDGLQQDAQAKALEIAQSQKPPPFGGEGEGGGGSDQNKPGRGGPPPPPPRKGPAVAASNTVGAATAFSHRAAFTPARPLYAHEAKVDFARMDDLLSQARDVFQREAKPLLIEMLVRAMPDVTRAMADGDPAEVASIRLDTSKLSTFVQQFLEQLRAEGYQHVRAEKDKSVAQVRKEQQSGDIVPAAPARVTASATGARLYGATKPEFDVDRLVRSQRDLLLRRMRSRVIDDLQREAIRQVRTGGDPAEIVSNVVGDALDANSLKQDAGIVVTSAFNIGREEFARENGGVSSVHLSAVLDQNTCEPCRGLDGSEFDFGSPEHEAHVPPLDECDGGDLCRCILVYDFDEADAGDAEEAVQ